ncbi:MAG: DegT/DnrJ/EryC1/StrS family aminotransferase, partial [Pseudomonadota bacterium]
MTHRLTTGPSAATKPKTGAKPVALGGDQPIAFIDLKAQQARIRPQIEKRLSAILDQGSYIAGPEIEALEEQIAHWTGARWAISCESGTDAL